MHHAGQILSGMLLGVLAVFLSTEVFAQADVIEKRQQVMKQQSADAKAIKAAVESKDYATIETKAKDLMGTAEKIPELFPKGSTKGKTKAKAEIWENWDDFTKKAKALKSAASDLAAAAKSKDHAAVEAKVKEVSGACSGCHKSFRAEKYPE
ncbi:MAG TPA: cytochrome c [Candidatus Eisenbacteria bacterium]|nr:cytochrome c [Candidatus Eisenbacteria bacterium]